MKKGTLEIVVGMFMIIGFTALVYLALQLGEVTIFSRGSTYVVEAEFDNVSGIKKGAAVQVSGVVVGSVEGVRLGKDHYAVLTMRLENELKIPVDSIASVKSQGIIGDKFIQINLGGDEELLEEGAMITDTESAIDIESLISKFAFGSAK